MTKADETRRKFLRRYWPDEGGWAELTTVDRYSAELPWEPSYMPWLLKRGYVIKYEHRPDLYLLTVDGLAYRNGKDE